MSSIAIGTYVDIDDGRWAFQNFAYGETRPYGQNSYIFGSFGYSGTTTDLQAGNVEASLVFNFNELVLNMAVEAADNRYVCTINTVWLDPVSFNEESEYTQDIFTITGFDHDSSRLSLRLASPLDAISGDVPKRKLATFMVGSLPSTGDVPLL